MKRLYIVAALASVTLLGVAGTAAATPAPPGPGNSAAAHACQNGGWQHLYTSTGASFSSEDDCVSYAAHGGVLVQRSLQQYFGKTSSPYYCGVYVVGSGFAPNTTYSTSSLVTESGQQIVVTRSVTTDASGAFDHFIFSWDQVQGATVQTTIDGVTSATQTISC